MKFEICLRPGESPFFKRSIESPSAWMSPWFLNSFLPGPRIDTEITIEVGSLDYLGLFWGRNICNFVISGFVWSGHWVLLEPEGKKRWCNWVDETSKRANGSCMRQCSWGVGKRNSRDSAEGNAHEASFPLWWNCSGTYHKFLTILLQVLPFSRWVGEFFLFFFRF